MAIRTIFILLQECGQGEPLGWSEFVRSYGGIGRNLLNHYFPTLSPDLDAHLVALFQRARARDNDWFKHLSISNERDFLMAFRDLVFAYGRETARVPVPHLSLDQVQEIRKDLSVFEREMLWLFIRGYSAQQIAPMMMNAAATAQAVKDVAERRLAQVLPGTTPDAFTLSARVLMEAAENTRSPQCLPIKTFNNLVNGQISWRERELAEEHIKNCFCCLDRFTAFQEMVRYRKDAQPLTQSETDRILGQLGLAAPRGRGVLAKIFSRMH